MKNFKLTDDLLTGIDEIDNQHRKLLRWANELSSDGVIADEMKINEALNNLHSYVDYHFQAEEKAMHNHAYDLMGKHKKQHERLRREVAQLFARSEGEKASRA